MAEAGSEEDVVVKYRNMWPAPLRNDDVRVGEECGSFDYRTPRVWWEMSECVSKCKRRDSMSARCR